MKKSQITILFISIFAVVLSGCNVSESLSPVTPTAAPTTTGNEARDVLFSMLGDNGGCQFPCVLGVEPGEMTRDEVLDRVSDLVALSPDISVYYSDFLVDVEDRCEGAEQCIREKLENQDDVFRDRVSLDWRDYYWFEQNNWNEDYSLWFGFHNDVVSTLNFNAYIFGGWGPEDHGNEIFSNKVQYYSLPNIIRLYGLPKETYILARKGAKTVAYLIHFILYYPEYGFTIEYLMLPEVVENDFHGCFSQSPIYLTTWDEGHEIELDILLGQQANYGDVNHYQEGHYKSIEEVFNMSQKEFFQPFLESDYDDCNGFPTELWPHIQISDYFRRTPTPSSP